MTDSHPLSPPPTPESQPFWEGTSRGELRVQRCRDTGRLLFPPRLLSPWGSHREPEWVAVSGRGTIWSFVMAHPPLLPYFAERAPYNVVLVALEEDTNVRMVGNWVAGQGRWPEAPDARPPAIGDRVQVVFDPLESGIWLPRWVSSEEKKA